MKVFFRSLLAALSVVSVSAMANVLADAADKESLKLKLQSLRMDVYSVANSPVEGLLQVSTSEGLFYVTEDGSHLVQGRIYNLDTRENETAKAYIDIRQNEIKRFDDSYIEYKAADEKYVVTVFTDITCGFCRKLHNQMEQYNERGITVRYLAFPRGGFTGSSSYNQMVSIWCSDDPRKALTEAKSGSSVTPKTCSNDVAEQYKFGVKVGVSGTPDIILSDGSTITGYKSPEELLAILEQKAG